MTTKRHPDLPSNYVSLAQLQERWIKEQQRKQKEREPHEEHSHKKLHTEAAETEHLSASPPPIRRNSNWKSNRRNLNGTNVEESKAASVAVVEEDENGKREEMKRKNKGEARAQEEGKVTGSEALALLVKSEKNNVGYERKREEKRMKKKGEARAQKKEGKVTGSEAHAVLVKSEKSRVGYERKREIQVKYRAKVEKVVEENNQTVEIEREIGDLSIDKESEKSKRQNKVINGRISNREYSDYANRGNGGNRGYNDGGYRGNGKYRGGFGRFDRRNGLYIEGYRRFDRENGRYGGGHGRFEGYGQWKGRENGKVWLKKEAVADGGDMAGNQSSSVSLKELE